MTIQEQIDQLKKEFDEKIIQIKNEVTLLTGFTGGNHQEVKPTRYYPNGAYMDEPEDKTIVYYIGDGGLFTDYYLRGTTQKLMIELGHLFPNKEAAEKELNRQRLTAKMYRDMRDDRINGDWMADWENLNMRKFIPATGIGRDAFHLEAFTETPIEFYYKNESFIKDLKAMGWTEEELKIVWFNN